MIVKRLTLRERASLLVLETIKGHADAGGQRIQTAKHRYIPRIHGTDRYAFRYAQLVQGVSRNESPVTLNKLGFAWPGRMCQRR